ncbi:NAD-dependent epimerase/dehydratase family protein [Chloroflexota bacterium]
MRIVITGATGFVGGYLVPSLAPDHDLFCLVRDPSRLPHDTNVIAVQGNLGVSDGLSELPDHADALLHFAQANIPFPDHANELFEVNAVSTQRLADYARQAGASAFVYASSGNVYGQNAAPLVEDGPVQPQGLYAMTKYVSEQVIACYTDFFNVCTLRLFAPYGPGQTGRMIPGIIGRVRAGQEVTVTNGGQPRINPVYIDDVVRATRDALLLTGHQVVNVAGPEVVSVEDVARIAGQALGVQPRLQHSTDPTVWNLVADTTRFHNLFSLPDMVPPSEGIRRMVEAETGR